MNHIKIFFFAILLSLSISGTKAQSNTAVTSGSIGKCGVWGYPYVLYNNAGATQVINDGVTITVDQNRNIGAINFASSGGMNLAGGNGVTMSGAAGEIGCRWDLPKNHSGTIINNNNTPPSNAANALGAYFTAPYSGTYKWYRTTGWAANNSGAYLNGFLYMYNTTTGYRRNATSVRESGTCPVSNIGGNPFPFQWYDQWDFAMDAGQTLNYGAQTAYAVSNPSCNNSRLDYTFGNAYIVFDN